MVLPSAFQLPVRSGMNPKRRQDALVPTSPTTVAVRVPILKMRKEATIEDTEMPVGYAAMMIPFHVSVMPIESHTSAKNAERNVAMQ